jgi:hypothetical protein
VNLTSRRRKPTVRTEPPRETWEAIVASDPSATVFQTPTWTECICATGGWTDCTRLYETADGRPLVLPMVRRAGLPGVLPVAESLPSAWGTGGLVTPGGQLQPGDIANVWGDLAADSFIRMRIRPEAAAVGTWDAAMLLPGTSVRRQHKSVVDLAGGFGPVWQRFKGTARTAIRKAERSRLVVQSGGAEFVPDYYRLYLTWVERRARERRLPVSVMLGRARRAEPLRKFRVVAEKLGPACRIWLARHDGEAVAAAIMLSYGTHATFWRGFSSAEAGPLRANDLLQKSMIETACGLGCRDYNLGWSGTQSLLAYKARFGAREVEFPVYSHERLPLTRLDDALAALRKNVGQSRARGSR